MPGKSNYLKAKVINHVLSLEAFTEPSSVFVALYTTAPTDDTLGVEVTGNGYARQEITATNFAVATVTLPQASNQQDITFPTATGGNWGTVVAFALLDAVTSGNMLLWSNLTTSKQVDDGDTVIFRTGQLTYSED